MAASHCSIRNALAGMRPCSSGKDEKLAAAGGKEGAGAGVHRAQAWRPGCRGIIKYFQF